MRMSLLVSLAILSGCASPSSSQLVMMNPRTGAVVGCEAPDLRAGSGEFLVSRACLSACQAHGFRPIPGAQNTSPSTGTPQACLD